MDSTAMVPVGCNGSGGAAIGMGMVFSKMIKSVARQPEAEPILSKYTWIRFALVETIALYALVIAFIIMGQA